MENRLAVMLEHEPSWVWDTASAYVSDGRRPRRRELPILRECYNFLCRYTKVEDDTVGLRDLMLDYPDLSRAHALHLDMLGDHWVVEAGLLTDAPFDEVAAYTSLDVGTIKKFGEVYYNVRPKLASRGYILNRIFMPALARGMYSRDYDFLYKTLAYCLGWKVFQDFIDAKTMSADSRSILEHSFKDRMLKLGWMAAHRAEVNNYNVTSILEQCLRLAELEKERGALAGQAEAYAVMSALLAGCKTTIVGRGTDLDLNEPRADELVVGAKTMPQLEGPK